LRAFAPVRHQQGGCDDQAAQGGTVGKIKQETRRGKTFYVAEVSDLNGKKHHVRSTRMAR